MKSNDRHHKEVKKKPKVRPVLPPSLPKINNFYFDPRSFEKTLADECEAAFCAYQERYKGETFYAYGLMTHAAFEFLYPTAITEEMLDRHVDSELTWHTEHYEGMSRENLRWYFRHRYGFIEDSDLRYDLSMSHEFGFFGFIASAQRVLSPDEVKRLEAEHSATYIQACLNALRTFDKKGIFGDEATRSHVTLFFSEANIDALPLNCVDVLNPLDIFTRYQTEQVKAEGFNPYRRKSV